MNHINSGLGITQPQSFGELLQEMRAIIGEEKILNVRTAQDVAKILDTQHQEYESRFPQNPWWRCRRFVDKLGGASINYGFEIKAKDEEAFHIKTDMDAQIELIIRAAVDEYNRQKMTDPNTNKWVTLSGDYCEMEIDGVCYTLHRTNELSTVGIYTWAWERLFVYSRMRNASEAVNKLYEFLSETFMRNIEADAVIKELDKMA